jgi:two-component system nitrogen regulation response regulator GlnG
MRVLIVDDDRATREGLAELLGEAGYESTSVGSFQDALRILRTRPPDLLITDVDLNDADGLQLLVNTPTRVPTIVLTGSYDLVLESEVRREGAEYLVKPVSPDRLLEQVRSMLGGASS